MSQATRDDPPDARQTDFYVVIPTNVIALGPYAIAVYAVLRDFADMRSHECWPSHRTIAERANISPRKVREVLTALKSGGWITWTQRKSDGGSLTTNVYHVHGSPTALRHDVPEGRQDMPHPPRQDVPEVRHDVPRELVPIELLPTEEQTSQPSRDDDPTPDVAHLVAVMSESLTRLGVKHKPTTEWARTFRLMIDLDERTPAQIEGAIRWAHADDFWSANIHSPRKLRKQFDQLRIQAARPNRKSTNQQNIELVGQLAGQPEGVNPWLLSPSARQQKRSGPCSRS